MAILLTTNYQLISTIYLTYGEVRTYAKYTGQSTTNNETYFALKTTYYTGQAGGVSFSSGSNTLDTTTKSYGYTTMAKGETTIQEVFRTQGHYQDGSSVIYTVYTSWSATFGGSGTSQGDIVFPKINRYATITSAPNFTDEDNPTIQYSVPNTSITSLQARIENQAGTTAYIQYRDIAINGTSYTFEFTNEEREHLRELTPNSNNLVVKFVIKTEMGGNTFWSVADRTMTIVNGNPTFTHSEVETSSKVINVLGSSSASTVVQNASIVRMTVVPTALKESSIASVSVSSGLNYSNTITTSPYVFDIPVTETGSFVITVTDSRGNQGGTAVSKTLIQYQNVDITTYNFERQNPTSANIDLSLEARYYQITVGSTVNAPVIKWKLEESGTYTTIPSSAYTIDTTNNKVTISSYQLTNVLSHELSGQFYVKLEDIFSEDAENMIVNKGIATYEAGEFDLQVNGDLIVADTEGENGYKIYNNFEYSTSKEIVIGKWIDDKPIYRKVYQLTVNANTTNSSTDLTSLGYDAIWINQGKSFCQYGGSATSSSVNWYGGTSDFGLVYVNASKKLAVRNQSANTRTYYITVEYTKTTD